MSVAIRPVVVTTPRGRVRGQVIDGVAVFKGIPYAALPFGANRFRPPTPPAPWEGIRDAFGYGPACPQTPYPAPFHQLLGDQGVDGLDCLNLNVWTPDPGAAGLPVMVWIHGGAFLRGSGAVPAYDGRRFARDGVVCVSVNYRLGADGFLLLRDGPANLGMLDQVAALAWVRDSIRAFGGDPGRVTVFGESAGAFSVATLIAMPGADGLFQQAIAQSGAGHHVVSIETARTVAGLLAERLGVAPTLDAMAAVPLPRFVQEQAELAMEMARRPDPGRFGEAASNGMLFEPVVDGTVIPARPIDRIAQGAGRGLRLLAGTTTEEWRFFTVPTGAIDLVTDDRLRLAAQRHGLEPESLAAYRASRPGATPGELLSALVTDWFFRIPAIRLAEAHRRNGGDAYLYEFAWRSSLFHGRLGACHAIEIPFVFDNLDRPMALLGDGAPQALADVVHRAWVGFASGGDPGWPRYDPPRRPVMRFDETGAVAVLDPGAAERRIWEGVR